MSDEKPLTEYKPVEPALREFMKLSPIDRAIAFSELNNLICVHCGDDQRESMRCQCSNDE